MKLLREYFKVLAYSLLGLVFAFASFYLLANLYHYLEIRKDFSVNGGFINHTVIVDIEDEISQIKRNISTFNANKYEGDIPVTKMLSIKTNIENCVNNIQNEEYKKLLSANKINILDVYRLREAYENNVYNNCIVSNLNWLTNEAVGDLRYNQDLTAYYFDALRSSTTYLKKDLINNSSYFYNTSVASTSIKENTKDGYYDVIDAYSKATNFVLYLSNWFKEEAEVQHD